MDFKISNKIIGKNNPTFIIAEMSANHGGKLETALEIVRAAKRAGADAIKLQTYKADTITVNCDKKDFIIPSNSPWSSHKTLWNLYDMAHTPWEWHEIIFEEAKKLNLEIFSTPFDDSAVDFLEELNVPAYKIASPEITNIPLLNKVASTGKPIILSSGISNFDDLNLAIETIRGTGNNNIAVLKCTSSYPAPIEEANLLTIPSLSKHFNVLTGISDHTNGTVAAIASVSLGGNIIEKHIKLNDGEKTVDSFFSLTENEFKKLIEDIRFVDKALGSVNYEVTKSALPSVNSRSSLYVVKKINIGDTFNKNNIKAVRPGYGLHPKFYNEIIGKVSNKNLSPGDRVSWDIIDE